MIQVNGILTIAKVVAVARDRERVELGREAREAVECAHDEVRDVVASNRRVYGVNTGFGDLQDAAIDPADLAQLQENIVRSHATSIGEPACTEVVRATMLARANTFALGYSGVSVGLVEQLLAFLNEGIHPRMPLTGSSDDLSAAAHIARALIGEGPVEYDGEELDAVTALDRAGLDPHDLGPKEGLAAVSGTPVMTGLFALALADIAILLRAADAAGALTFAAVGNAPDAFDHRIAETRPHEGHTAVADNIRRLLGERTDGGDDMTQDPLSLRLIPQVHGTARQHTDLARDVVETELASATDNPLVFPNGDVCSCGNFCGQPLASAADTLASVLTKVGATSERRTATLLSNADQPFLAGNPGLESGLMITQYTAAGLTAENRLTGTASEGSVCVSAGQEDVHSMGTIAVRNLAATVDRVRHVLAVELLCAARYAEQSDLALSESLSAIAVAVREVADLAMGDVPLYDGIEQVADLVESGALAAAAADGGVLLD